MKRFIITGAPGAGKTAILRQLQLDGFGVVEEAAVRTLGFITRTDARQISFDEALRFERIHEDTYRDFGFDLISVAAGSLPERVAAIKAAVR